MKTRRATIVSIVGVLAAGSLAAFVNSQALAGSGSQADTALAALQFPATTSTTTAAAAVTTVARRPAEATDAEPGDSHEGNVTATSGEPATSSTTAASIVAVDSHVVVGVGDAGQFTVDHADGVLTLVAAVPAPGWQVARTASATSTEVVVVFTSTATELTATADLTDGVVAATYDVRAVPKPPGPRAPAGPSGWPATTPAPHTASGAAASSGQPATSVAAPPSATTAAAPASSSATTKPTVTTVAATQTSPRTSTPTTGPTTPPWAPTPTSADDAGGSHTGPTTTTTVPGRGRDD